MTIDNFNNFQYSDLNSNDILICALGYENRSHYLLTQNLKTRDSSNTLIIRFDDLDIDGLPDNLSCKIESLKIKTEICSYNQGEKFQDVVLAFLNAIIENKECGNIYIDYSSMPRNWYCRLPHRIENVLEDKCLDLIFLYVAGIYPEAYKSYPTAGIDCLKLFSGGSLPKIDSQRTHLVALSYDVPRTQSLLSILEPEFLIVCYAYDTLEKKAEIESVNKDIIRRASASVALPIKDFVYILQKLNEIILEQTRDGQIVIIPDGPKPLIFAMSLASLLVDIDEGITCLHVNRNERLTDNKVAVSAIDDEIYGVKISINTICV